jgi:hypothetical protein
MPTPLYLATHVFIAPYVAGNYDKTHKGSISTHIGDIDAITHTPEYVTKEHMGPVGGLRRRKGVTPVGYSEKMSFTLTETGGFAYGLLFGCATPANGSNVPFNPGSKGTPWEGWMQIQQVKADGVTHITVDRYVSATCGPVTMNDGEVNFTVECSVIHSTLQVGLIDVLA